MVSQSESTTGYCEVQKREKKICLLKILVDPNLLQFKGL